MGDTFRRITLGPRKKSIASNHLEVKTRRRSIYERSISTGAVEHNTGANSPKIMRPTLRFPCNEDTQNRERGLFSDGGEPQEKAYKGEGFIIDYNRKDGCVRPRKVNIDDKKDDKSKLKKLQQIHSWLKEMIERNETLVQALIILPIIFTALYILFIERGDLLITGRR